MQALFFINRHACTRTRYLTLSTCLTAPQLLKIKATPYRVRVIASVTPSPRALKLRLCHLLHLISAWICLSQLSPSGVAPAAENYYYYSLQRIEVAPYGTQLTHSGVVVSKWSNTYWLLVHNFRQSVSMAMLVDDLPRHDQRHSTERPVSVRKLPSTDATLMATTTHQIWYCLRGATTCSDCRRYNRSVRVVPVATTVKKAANRSKSPPPRVSVTSGLA